MSVLSCFIIRQWKFFNDETLPDFRLLHLIIMVESLKQIYLSKCSELDMSSLPLYNGVPSIKNT